MIRLLVISLFLWVWSTLGEAQNQNANTTDAPADAARGVLVRKQGLIETQITCPERIGDAWGGVNPRSWNTLEIGLQTSTQNLAKAPFELYSRYNCRLPLDQTSSQKE